mmetsp:Transcript_7999/g.10135  ORF Transcript_7999/g.10135 Transcript_7999/m.10135 type:complete len:84 (-) Transcript_7999:383-634(-)
MTKMSFSYNDKVFVKSSRRNCFRTPETSKHDQRYFQILLISSNETERIQIKFKFMNVINLCSKVGFKEFDPGINIRTLSAEPS